MRRHNRHFTKEDIQIASKKMKRFNLISNHKNVNWNYNEIISETP
jgi:hypothetical protein